MKYNDKNILHVVNIYFVLPYFIGGQFKYFRAKGYNFYVVCSKSEYLAEYARENSFDYRFLPVLRSINIIQDLKTVIGICHYIKDKQIGIVVGHTPKGGALIHACRMVDAGSQTNLFSSRFSLSDIAWT